MEKSAWDLVRLIFPMGPQKRAHLKALEPYLSKEDRSYAKYLLKLGRIGVSYAPLSISQRIMATPPRVPKLHAATQEQEVSRTVSSWNAAIRAKSEESCFKEFSKIASTIIPGLIAPHIIGMEDAKQAAALQLFCPERIHLLLLGDPGTGKTEILRSASSFAPISSFGLGSGTSGVGLSAAKKGNEMVLGVLPQADKGLACIDELNLMKPQDRGALLNAMEKGFITYDKGASHLKLPAEVRVLATANPKGDRFIGSSIRFLKEQLPFEAALLSRFHLVFLIRRPDREQFRTIAKSLLDGTSQPPSLSADDVSFVRSYISYAERLTVEFDPKIEPVVTSFFDGLKAKEEDFLVELSPRIVLGAARLAKASARMSLRTKVTREDVEKALSIIKGSLEIPLDEESKRGKKKLSP